MLQKYGAALVSIAIAAAVFLQSAFRDSLDAAEVSQLVAIVAGAITVYLVPLVSGPWAGALKTTAAIAAAAATAIAPLLLTGTITPEQWTVVILAALNALGVEIGVAARRSGLQAEQDGAPVIEDDGSGTTTLVAGIPPQAALDPEGARRILGA